MKNKIKELQDKFDIIMAHVKVINRKSPENTFLRDRIDNISWHLNFSIDDLKYLSEQIDIGKM